MTVTLASTLPATLPAPSSADGLGAVAPWITATLRPAGSLGRDDTGRLRGLLDVLSANASMVVIDLESARVRSGRLATAIEEAAEELECRGGCLVCVNADPGTRALLAAAGHHLVLVDQAPEPRAVDGRS
jgi:hypothetical protein